MVRENERAHEFEANFGEYVCDGYAFQLTFFFFFSFFCRCVLVFVVIAIAAAILYILLKENIYIYMSYLI